MGYLMSRKKPQLEVPLKLTLAYQRMNKSGKGVLERLVRQLESIHTEHIEVFCSNNSCRKCRKKGRLETSSCPLGRIKKVMRTLNAREVKDVIQVRRLSIFSRFWQ
jgi:hypothetical protein